MRLQGLYRASATFKALNAGGVPANASAGHHKLGIEGWRDLFRPNSLRH